MKQPYGRGCPTLYHSILLYYILSMATVANKCILLEFAPIMPAFCSLLLPSIFSKNYAGKIGASLLSIHMTLHTKFEVNQLSSLQDICLYENCTIFFTFCFFFFFAPIYTNFESNKNNLLLD